MPRRQKTKTRGRSTPMPSVKLDLGRFVTVRKRADGTHRVLFELPPRLRPSGWLPTTPLPILGDRTGDLTDTAEVGRIQADAAKLYAEYLQARGSASAQASRRNVRALVRSWEGSQRYKLTKPRTQQGYAYLAKDVIAWAESIGDPDPTKMTRARVEQFLALYDDRPTSRYHIVSVLRQIMDQAVALGWRADNPVAGIKVSVPKSTVTIWEQEDVERLMWAAAVGRQPELAAIILTEWEIGQRLTDVTLFRRGADYMAEEGMFRFWQGKTGSYVTIPVSDRLRALLAMIERKGSPYLFHDGKTGRPFPDVDRLGHVFDEVRGRAGGRHVVLRALRHSCVVQLARCACTVPEIASITGHSISTVEAILSIYLPRDNEVARNAQVKRGLVQAKVG